MISIYTPKKQSSLLQLLKKSQAPLIIQDEQHLSYLLQNDPSLHKTITSIIDISKIEEFSDYHISDHYIRLGATNSVGSLFLSPLKEVISIHIIKTMHSFKSRISLNKLSLGSLISKNYSHYKTALALFISLDTTLHTVTFLKNEKSIKTVTQRSVTIPTFLAQEKKQSAPLFISQIRFKRNSDWNYLTIENVNSYGFVILFMIEDFILSNIRLTVVGENQQIIHSVQAERSIINHPLPLQQKDVESFLNILFEDLNREDENSTHFNDLKTVKKSIEYHLLTLTP